KRRAPDFLQLESRAAAGTQFANLENVGMAPAFAQRPFEKNKAARFEQTIMPCIVGLGVGLAATLGPGIIKGMFTLII
ncbi:hypothetical protein ACRPFF_11330, partial [Neisseria sp. SLRRB23]